MLFEYFCLLECLSLPFYCFSFDTKTLVKILASKKAQQLDMVISSFKPSTQEAETS